MFHTPGLLASVDDVFSAIGGKDALVTEALRLRQSLPPSWFSVRIASLLTRARKTAQIITVHDAGHAANAAYVALMVPSPS